MPHMYSLPGSVTKSTREDKARRKAAVRQVAALLARIPPGSDQSALLTMTHTSLESARRSSAFPGSFKNVLFGLLLKRAFGKPV